MITHKEKLHNLLKNGIPTIQMVRLRTFGRRIYIKENPFNAYSGLTGALESATMKGDEESKRLTSWRDGMLNELGRDKTNSYVDSTANFGTLLHESVVRIWEKKYLDWKWEQEYAENYFLETDKKIGINSSLSLVKQRVYEYCKHAASLMQFIHDYIEDIIAVEAMCYSDELGIATPIDVVCKIKGKIVTINIKTSTTLGKSHYEQVVVEKYLWNLCYPDNQAQFTGLIRTKDWNESKVPTYELKVLKEEEENKLLEDVLLRLKIAKHLYYNFNRPSPYFTGSTKIGDKPEIQYKSLEEEY